MTGPVIAEHDVTVYLGDVRERLAELPAGSVQCCVTSPPYYGLRDYGVDGQIGSEPTPGDYIARLAEVFREVRRVLADDGVLWLNLGDSYSSSSTFAKNLMGIPWRVAFALQSPQERWILRNEVIWHKTDAMPESVTDRLSSRHEHLFLFAKSRRYAFDLDAIREAASSTPHAMGQKASAAAMQNGWKHHGRLDGQMWTDKGRNPGDVWSITTSKFPGAHFATMPPELARRCILAGCPEGATVLDPFTGSGTTAKVARSLGRRFVGIELNPDYIPIIRDRIGQEPFNFGEAS